ncbi:unnamed protein product [Brassica rapa]|uniref:Uncharacterized protein n=2 Tax=Brassica TaxID=3705 RepID=A0A3P5Z922_BRACM|nr:unnamed protein product [Brassica napus]CAG7872939.1 unnamed protein product [Brassica rapa]CDY17636.1 BnaA06g34550D [Brassica napus]VDC68738.1 unnamed protein product [Brassica rapa]
MLERLVMYEQTVRKLWQSEHYNDNLRYLKVKGFENTCYALHLEFQPKVKTANEIFNLIISRRERSFMIWLRYCGTLLVSFVLFFRYSSSIKVVWNLGMIILAWGRQRWVHINVGKLKNHCQATLPINLRVSLLETLEKTMRSKWILIPTRGVTISYFFHPNSA